MSLLWEKSHMILSWPKARFYLCLLGLVFIWRWWNVNATRMFWWMSWRSSSRGQELNVCWLKSLLWHSGFVERSDFVELLSISILLSWMLQATRYVPTRRLLVASSQTLSRADDIVKYLLIRVAIVIIAIPVYHFLRPTFITLWTLKGTLEDVRWRLDIILQRLDYPDKYSN